MLVKLAWKNIWHKPLNSILSLLLLASSISIMAIVLLVQQQFEEQFTKQLNGVDLILGAQGSPLQLVLSSLYHVDSPTGNISLAEANQYLKHPHVKRAIPLAFGDNYAGYKIVGTTADFLKKYKGTINEGRFFKSNFEAVVGHQVALKQNLKIGDIFHGTHGDDEDGHVHDEKSYEVVGILSANESILDYLVLCNTASVWEIHNHSEIENDSVHEITAALLQMKNKMSILTWQRQVSAESKLQAVSPAIEINRLFSLFGIGIEGLKYLAFGLMFISAISIFIALYNALKSRKYEFALMRISGAKQWQLLWTLMLEGLFLGIVGFIIGLIFSRIGLYFLSLKSQADFKLPLKIWQFKFENEGVLLIFTLIIVIFATLIPAIKTYQLSIAKTISHA